MTKVEEYIIKILISNSYQHEIYPYVIVHNRRFPHVYADSAYPVESAAYRAVPGKAFPRDNSSRRRFPSPSCYGLH